MTASDQYLPVPASEVLPSGFPSPRDLGKALIEQIGRQVTAVRKERGDVHLPEDTYSLVRSLIASNELLKDYARAFTGAAKVAEQETEEELMSATGEQDGTPLGGMTVPDARGDIRISLDYVNSYDIDVDMLKAAVCAVVTEEHGKCGEAVQLALDTLLGMGKFQPQVSKVRKFAQQNAREGDDSLAAVVTSAIRKDSTYKGIKTERK